MSTWVLQVASSSGSLAVARCGDVLITSANGRLTTESMERAQSDISRLFGTSRYATFAMARAELVLPDAKTRPGSTAGVTWKP